MTVGDPETLFRSGRVAFRAQKPALAASLFKQAIDLERERHSTPQMRYLSYYGLAMAQAHSPSHACLEMCEKAVRREGYDAELQLNLGRLYAMVGRTTRALETLERARRLDPRNPRIRAELSRLDRRARPAIARLGRDHVVNRTLNRLRRMVGTDKAQAPN